MATYDYKCEDGHIQEEIHSMNDSPTIECKECKKKMVRVISGGAMGMVKSGKVYVGDLWDEAGVMDPTAPNYNQQAMDHKIKTKQIKRTQEELKEEHDKKKRDGR